VHVPLFPQKILTDSDRWNLLQRKAQAVRVGRAFDLLRTNGVEPILIKGLAASRFYPDSHFRWSIDIDLAVSAEDFEIAERLARSSEAEGLAIDLHRELRNHDSVPWPELVKHSENINIEGQSIRVLRPEDHLRVLCVHWLTDGGTNQERLWDIYYAIDNRPKDFDWDRFLNIVSERRKRWLVCAVGLAHRKLGLDLDNTPVKNEALDLPAWLIKTIEQEWSSETPDQPLEMTLTDRKALLTQIKKRLNPNAISATVLMKGSFDARTRVFYQIGNIFMRIAPSYQRVSRAIKLRSR